MSSRWFSLLTLLFAWTVLAQDDLGSVESPEAEQSVNATEIQEAIDAYLAAFNTRDVDQLLSLWSPDGIYESRTTGERLTGRDALRKEFESVFSGDDSPKLGVETESIEFISPNVALERGIATVTTPSVTDRTRYQVVYVKRDGKWLIDRITEELTVVQASNYEKLKALEFMVGSWVTTGDDMTIEIDCQWTANQNFLSRRFTVNVADVVESSGLQLIGWDAKEKQIRSWLFDSGGTVIRGTWEARDEAWVVQSVATFADGSSGSSTSFIRPAGPDSLAWRKTNRVVDGKLLPNTEEITMFRNAIAGSASETDN